MPEWEISWTFGGYTTVEADSREEALEKFEGMDQEAVCKDAVSSDPDLEVVGVYRV